jgi:hypothetical protein
VLWSILWPAVEARGEPMRPTICCFFLVASGCRHASGDVYAGSCVPRNSQVVTQLSMAKGAPPTSGAKAVRASSSSTPMCRRGGFSSTSAKDPQPASPQVACSPVAALAPEP